MEIFKTLPILDCKYEVSNLGRVKSLERLTPYKGGTPRRIKEKILNPSIAKTGYPVVNLSGRVYLVHQLVGYTFLDYKPDIKNVIINHIDGNRENNHLDNLEVTTQRKNVHKGRMVTDRTMHVGVYKENSTYRARIYYDGSLRHLGRFSTEKEAGEAYDNFLKTI